jgi:ATP adenylyltransferase
MEVMWSPWRSKYIEGFKEEIAGNEESCFLCDAVNKSGIDSDIYVVEKRDECFVILNKFPYNNGHVLIAPYRHISNLEDLTDEELTGLMRTLRDSVKALGLVYKPHGYNAGINLGRTAGAGVPGHLHFHVVPRWDGDTSFMATLSDTKIVSQSLEDTKRLMVDAFIYIK